MKTPTRIRSLIHEFSNVGPETKGYSFEIVLTFLAAISLAAFVYFSFEKQNDEFAANSAQIVNPSQNNESLNTGSIR